MKWLLFITLTLWFYLGFQWLTARRRKMQERVLGAVPEEKTAKKPTKTPRQAPWRGFARRFASGWVRNWSQSRLDKLQAKLSQAGNPMNATVAEWIGIRFITTLLGFAIGAFLLWLQHGQLTGLAGLLCCILLGWIGPDFWLSRRCKLRKIELLKQLPNALDLLTVSVEAGLGFDQAISRLAQKMKGALSEEFERALREIQLGSQRAAALQRLAVRTDVDAISTFVSAVIQADKLGIGMAQVLRVQSAEVRRKRRMDAEERAMKAPVKMLFPLVLFVFPALFVIILGPALLHIMVMFGA